MKKILLTLFVTVFSASFAGVFAAVGDDAVWIKVSPKRSDDVTYIQADLKGNALVHEEYKEQINTKMGKVDLELITNFIKQAENSGIFTGTGSKVDSRQLFYKTSSMHINIVTKGELKTAAVDSEHMSRTLKMALTEFAAAADKLPINRNVYRFLIVHPTEAAVSTLDSAGFENKETYPYIETYELEKMVQLDEAVTYPGKLMAFRKASDFAEFQKFLTTYNIDTEAKKFKFSTSRGDFEAQIFIPNTTKVVEDKAPPLIIHKKRRRR